MKKDRGIVIIKQPHYNDKKKYKLKTRFNIAEYVFFKKGTKDQCVAYYESMFKDFGWKIDVDMEDVYIDFDELIHLKKGDIVDLDLIYVVKRKVTHPIKGFVEYFLDAH
jgi:hypothetical protein